MIQKLLQFLAAFFKKPVPPPVYVPTPTISPTLVTPPEPVSPLPPSKGDILYAVAFQRLGTDITPDDQVPDSLDCADTVNTLYYMAFGSFIALPGESTIELSDAMRTNPTKFQRLTVPQKGCIYLARSDYKYGVLVHGHVGIMGNSWIMSNDSESGKLLANYTPASFDKRYRDELGLGIELYRCL